MLAYILIGIIITLAIFGTVKRIRYGSSCCGEREPAPKKIRVKDSNKSNYPFFYILDVDGMHCSNCARRVENSFNKLDGIWAKADVGKKKVELRSKSELSEAHCREILNEAGYTLIFMNKTK